MPADIPANVSYIGGVWCEGVLYGIHLVAFGVVYSIFFGRFNAMGQAFTTATLLVFSFCMFALSTAHVGLAVQSLFQGFIYQTSETTEAFFRDNVFPNRKAVYIVNTLLGDSLLVWRVCVVWQRNWAICGFPLFLLLGTAACGIKTIVANAVSSHSSVFDLTILSWATATFVLNITTQITATALIASHIYRAFGLTGAGSRHRSRYMSLVWLIVETGAIYTSAALVQLVAYLLKMNAGVLMEFILAQICAIAPALIIIRVALGFACDSGDKAPDIVLTTFHDTYDMSPNTNDTQGDNSVLDTLESVPFPDKILVDEAHLRFNRQPSSISSRTTER